MAGRLRHLSDTRLPRTCAGSRPDLSLVSEPEQAAKVALCALGRRHAVLSAEIAELEALIGPLVKQINPALLALNGVGPDSAGQLLVTAARTPNAYARSVRSRCSVASRRSRHPLVRLTATDSTAAETGKLTPPSTASS